MAPGWPKTILSGQAGASLKKWGEKRGSRTLKSQKVFGNSPYKAKTPLQAGLYVRMSTQDQQTFRCKPVPCGNTPRAGAGRSRRLLVKEIDSGASR
jgi:hypothetical protein